MFNLRRLHEEAIPAALEKAKHYRLLNEPGNAESICLDILEIQSDNQQALVTLLLAMTDRMTKDYAIGDAQIKGILERLSDDYERAYYTGIVAERRAKVELNKGTELGRHAAYDLLHKAMEWFEKAEAIRPHGNDDSILRWNTCARIIQNNNLEPREEVEFHLE
jgi:hypothetical protein